MSIFIKYPPKGDATWDIPTVVSRTFDDGHFIPADWEPCTIGIEEEYSNAVRQIEKCEWSFNETGNPLYALEAFAQATSVKLYPPLWVIEFLDQRFKHALFNGLSLDRAFGFSGKGLGKGKTTDPKTSDRLRERNRKFCMVIFKLEGIGLSRPEACRALSSLLARLPDGKMLSFGNKGLVLTRMDISWKGIEKAVNESANLWSREAELTAEAAKTWTESEKASLLSIFYPSELPKRRRTENGFFSSTIKQPK